MKDDRDDLDDTRALPDPEPQLGGTGAAGYKPGSCTADPGPRDLVYKINVGQPAGHYEPRCFTCGERLEERPNFDPAADRTTRYWCPRCQAHPFAIAYRFVRDPEPEAKP